MGLLKNRNVTISVVDTTALPISIPVGVVDIFVKSINYDLKPSLAEFNGLKQADTLPWYSSIYEFAMIGDSYFNPFTIPNLYKPDNNIIKLYNLYTSFFHEGDSFNVGQYKVMLLINNCPLNDDLFEGGFSVFNFKEDEKLGLITYNITIEGKSVTQGIKQTAIDAFLKNLNLNT
jgi:hypothetical protein